MAHPRVSIGLPVFNGDNYLRATLESILVQDFEDFELIISNNASTDSTEEICLEFAARDRRVRYVRNQTNIGASPNYNQVFRMSRAQLFKWASYDDRMHERYVGACVRALESRDDAVLAFTRAEIIDDAGTLVRQSPDCIEDSRAPARRLRSLMRNRHYAHLLWGVVRSEALRRTRLMGTFEADHILLAELAMLGVLVEVPELLYQQRRHARSAMEIHRTPAALASWHDPKAKVPSLPVPHELRWVGEYLRAALGAPIGVDERAKCCGTIAAVELSRIARRVTRPVRQRFGVLTRNQQ